MSRIRKRGIRSSHNTTPQSNSTRLTVSLLENRLAPAVLTVNSLADTVSSGGPTLTLAEAVARINSSNSTDTIQFAPGLFGTTPQQITLSGELQLDRSVSIIGPGARELIVSGNNDGPVVEVGDGATVTISGITITGGSAENSTGGGVVNLGTLTLTDVVVTGNSAETAGGIENNGTLTLNGSSVAGNTASNAAGILNRGILTMTDSTVANNTSGSTNAGIDNFGSAKLIDSAVTGNVATVANGGLANYGGKMSLIDSTVSGNKAVVAAGIGNYLGGILSLTHSAVVNNVGESAGGILNTATMTLSDSTVSNNEVGGSDGLVITSVAFTLPNASSSSIAISSSDNVVLGNDANPALSQLEALSAEDLMEMVSIKKTEQ